MKKLSSAFNRVAVVQEGAEPAMLLYEEHGATTTLGWSDICSITQLGTKVEHPNVHPITLPDPPDATAINHEVSEEQLVMSLPTSFVESEPWLPAYHEGRRCLQWIVDSHTRPRCVINWSTGGIDAKCLPYLPMTTKELKLCDMRKFLSDPVPPTGSCNSRHWIHDFVQKLGALEKLTLSGRGYHSKSLLHLRDWTGSLDIRVEDGEVCM